MVFWEVVYNLGLFGLIVAGISFIARSLITQYFSKKLESYKAQLKNDSQREVQNLKSALARTAYEHQIRFSRLYEKAAKVVEQTHSNLVDLQNAASKFVRLFYVNEEWRKENRDNLWKAADKFLSDFERQRIYLDQDVCQKISDLREKLSRISGVLANLIDDRDIDKYPDTIFTEWEKANAILEQEVPSIRKSLTASFQEFLGIIKSAERAKDSTPSTS